MGGETIAETVARVADIDGMHLAGISLGVQRVSGTPEYQASVVVHIPRVRKLYGAGKEAREAVIQELPRLQQEWLDVWPETVAELESLLAERGWVTSETAGDIRRFRAEINCMAATYLRAELGDYDALPLFAKQYRTSSGKPLNLPPISQGITLYAMHRLASSYPREGLSPQAVKALDDYLQAATEHMLPPQQLRVTLWDASHSESDPRFAFMGYRKEVLEGQGSMMMPVYPLDFSDGNQMVLPGCRTTERLDALFEKLNTFVTLAYPDRE